MEMDLKNIQWGEFEIGKIFKIENCKCSNVSLLQNGNIPYVGATNRNNGVLKFVKPVDKLITKGNCIAFICDGEGSVGFSIYKEEDFIGSTTVKVGRSKNLNKYIASFIITIADTVRSKYNFGFKRNETHLKKEKVLLPQNSKGEPDYVFMEQFMRQKEQEKIDKFQSYIAQRVEQVKDFKTTKHLNQIEWGEFFIEEIAQIISGRDIYEAERKKGNVPYVSATANNNGIGYFVGNINETLEENCLSVNRNGSVGYSFYHNYKALFSNDCRKLRLKNKSPFVGKFISRIITGQKDKYGYGYKMGTGRIKRQKILLPIDKNGQPDYNYMENYIKKLEYEKLTKYITRKTTNA